MTNRDRTLEPSTNRKVFAIAAFAAVWTLLIAAMDFSLVPEILAQRETERFVKTEGTILSSRVETRMHPEHRVYLYVSFEYEAGGTRRTSDHWSFHKGSLDFEWACMLQKRWDTGMKVPVYVNPTNPDEAVLITGILPRQWLMMLFMFVFHVPILLFWSLTLSMWIHPEYHGEKAEEGSRTPVIVHLLGGISLGSMTGAFVGLLATLAISMSGQASMDAAPTKVAIVALCGLVVFVSLVCACLSLLGIGWKQPSEARSHDH